MNLRTISDFAFGRLAMVTLAAACGGVPGDEPAASATYELATSDDGLSGDTVIAHGSWIGRLYADGRAYVTDAWVDDRWVLQYTGVKQLVLSGDRIGVVTDNGDAWVKNGSITASNWTLQWTGVKQLALSGDRIGVLGYDGNVFVKEGDITASNWVHQFGSVKQLALSGNRIGVLSYNGNVYAKEGSLYAGWVNVFSGRQISLAGDRIAVLGHNGNAYIKRGTLYDTWSEILPWDEARFHSEQDYGGTYFSMRAGEDRRWDAISPLWRMASVRVGPGVAVTAFGDNAYGDRDNSLAGTPVFSFVLAQSAPRIIFRDGQIYEYKTGYDPVQAYIGLFTDPSQLGYFFSKDFFVDLANGWKIVGEGFAYAFTQGVYDAFVRTVMIYDFSHRVGSIRVRAR